MKEFVVVPELDYSVVVQRLLGETAFWARDALLCLLQDNMFPSRCTYCTAGISFIIHTFFIVIFDLVWLVNYLKQPWRRKTG